MGLSFYFLKRDASTKGEIRSGDDYIGHASHVVADGKGLAKRAFLG